MKAIHNYIATNEEGRDYAVWRVRRGVGNAIEIVDDLRAAGATVGVVPTPGAFLIGNIYNTELNWLGGVGVTSRITNVTEMFDGYYAVRTESGSEYALYNPAQLLFRVYRGRRHGLIRRGSNVF